MRHCGIIDPGDIDHYIANGGYAALDNTLKMNPEQVIEQIERSGLRGRGGAGFPTGRKWRGCRDAEGASKYIICNADEGDPGAFMDREVMEGDPQQIIEGMVIAGYAVGASKGYIYVRAEYPLAIERMRVALQQAEERGLLGENILGSGTDFHIEIAAGAGAFVSGEETALIAAIQGELSEPRPRPPYPSAAGLWGKPTVINNVKTFSCVPLILERGADWFASIGVPGSTSTAVFTLAGKVNDTGMTEVPMGTTLRTIIYEIAGGIRGEKQVKGVQIGGPSGGCLPESLLDTPVTYDSLREAGSMMGSGGMITMDEDDCAVDTARFFLDFTTQESCGKCTPCRLGTMQMLRILEDISAGQARLEDIDLLESLAEDVKQSSLCGLGRTAPNPVLTTLRYFRDEYEAHIVDKICPAKVCPNLTAYFIVDEKCDRACEHCVLTCPTEAIEGGAGKPKHIDQEKCVNCGTCLTVCPPEYSAVVKLSPITELPSRDQKAKEKAIMEGVS
jgi:NADH-quinone oxidoreductase subunit F